MTHFRCTQWLLVACCHSVVSVAVIVICFVLLTDINILVKLTERVTWSSFEDDTVRREEDRSLGWQKHRTANVTTNTFVAAVRQKERPQSVNDKVFTRQQHWCQDLRLTRHHPTCKFGL